MKDWELEETYEEVTIENVGAPSPEDKNKPKDPQAKPEDKCEKFSDKKP